MSKQDFSLTDFQILSRLVSRRGLARIVAATALIAAPAALGAPARSHAKAQTPDAGEAPIAAFMDLSAAFVGGGRLDETRGTQLLGLIEADAERRASLDRLLAIRTDNAPSTPIAAPLAVLESTDRELAEQILRFWYLGVFDGQPVEDRAGFWFGLSAWQAVGYTYAPSVCRAFGQWAQPPPT